MTTKLTWTRGLVAAALLAGFTSAHALKFVDRRCHRPQTRRHPECW